MPLSEKGVRTLFPLWGLSRCVPPHGKRVLTLFSVGGGAVLLLMGLLLAPFGAPGQVKPPILEPDWDRTFEAGIEWCAPVGGEAATGLLLCTKDARVNLIDLETGKSCWAEPIAIQPGMQFAGENENVAYGFGVSQVYAFLVGSVVEAKEPQPGLLWQVAAAPKGNTEGDPEHLTRLVAAKATPAGVLIVRSDGRVAELFQKDGSVRWKHELPKLANCTLHVRGSKAALLDKRGGAFEVAFFDLRLDRPQPRIATVNYPLPIWTALIDQGLVVVWPGRFAVIPAGGEPRLHEMQGRVGARATTVGVYVPRKVATGNEGARSRRKGALLFVIGGDGDLCAYDLDSGGLAWPDEGALSALADANGCRSLWVSGDYVIQMGRRWFAVRQVGSGRSFQSRLCSGEPIGAGVHDRFAYGLFARGDSAAARDGVRTIRLVRGVMGEAPRSRRDEPPAPGVREFRLGTASPIRDTFWLGGVLVFVEDRRMRAYALP